MPVKITAKVHDGSDKLYCYRCLEPIKDGERYLSWTVNDYEYVQCSYHRSPTKVYIGLSVLQAFGYTEQPLGSRMWRINRVNGRGTVLNPATPSYLNLEQVLSLYETPERSLVETLIEENFHINQYMKLQAEEEIRESTVTEDAQGIRRGARVLGKGRSCSNCGVSEAEMVAKNPRYTLCRGVCVVCYRKMFRGKKTENAEGSGQESGLDKLQAPATGLAGPAEA